MARHEGTHADHSTQPPIWRTNVALSAALVVATIILTFLGFRWLTSEHTAAPGTVFTADSAEPAPFSTPAPPAESPVTPTSDELIVHVAGEVHDPGIVTLPAGSRVIDAIQGAGGATDNAQLDALNLAAHIHDGDYVLVPDRSAQPPAAGQPPGAAAAPGSPATINLNTADSAALETLPGVGPATAAKILQHREQHGPYTALTDLEAVSGIGPSTLARLDGLVTW